MKSGRIMEIAVLALLALVTVDGAAVKASWENNTIETANDVTCVSWTDCTEECGGGRRTCERSNGKTMGIDCHLQDCSDIEDCGSADIVYVLDASTSIGDKNFWITKQFTIDVMKGLRIGEEYTRIGMVTYADNAHTRWELGEHMTEDDLEEAIWALPYEKGVTNTQEGLLHAQRIIERTARASVKHMVVIITDGVSNVKPDRTIPQAEEMHAQGIEIFAIGIGGINEEELEGIASEIKDEHWHHVPNHEALVAITNVVINETCNAMTNKSECDEWSDWSDCTVHDGGCGAGNRSRSRECRFYNYEGAEPIKRTDWEYEPCVIPCPSTTPHPPRPYCYNWTECDAKCDRIGFRRCYRTNGRIWKIPCCGPPCVIPPCEKADVVFILDSSNSIGNRNWYEAKQFAISLVERYPLATTDIRIAAVTFSREATTEFRLGDHTNEEDIKDALWALPWAQSVTNSQDGLKHAKAVFDESPRDGVNKIAIFLSDGESNVKKHQTIPAAEALHDDDVHVFAVAVRFNGIDELKGIASDPVEDYYHQIDEYDDLVNIVDAIIKESCH